MSLLPSVAARITVEATRYRSAVSEFLVQSLGKSINYLLDENDQIQIDLSDLATAINSNYGFYSASKNSGVVSNSVTTASDEYKILIGFGNTSNNGDNKFDALVVSPSSSGNWYNPGGENYILITFKKISV